MNKIIPVIAIVFAFTLGTIFSADIATAVKPVTEVLVTNTEPIEVTGSLTSNPACPAENVQHWNKIVFSHTIPFTHPTLPPLLDDSSLPNEVIVQVDPNIVNIPKQLVADKLTELGYTKGGVPLDADDIKSLQVTYSTICAEN